MIRLFLLIFAAIFCLRSLKTTSMEEKVSYYSVKEAVKIKPGSIFDSICAVYASYGIRFPEVAVCQSYWETGGFSSPIWIQNKNSFGMKYNNRGYAVRKNRGHAAYPDGIASLKDYAAWQRLRIAAFESRYHKIRTTEDYINMLDSVVISGNLYRYAEDSLYTRHIRETYSILKEL